MLYTTLSRDASLALGTNAGHARPLPVFEHLVDLFESGLQKLKELALAHTEPPPCTPENPCPNDDDDINPRVRLSPEQASYFGLCPAESLA